MSTYESDLTRTVTDDRFVLVLDREGAEYIRMLCERDFAQNADAGAFVVINAYDEMFEAADR